VIKTEPIDVLAEYLEVSTEELSEESYDYYGLPLFSLGSQQYAIALMDDDATDATVENIKESLWAFTSSFIVSECGLPYDLSEVFAAYQENRCESANDAILSLIEKTCTLKTFVDDAISADGRGHFLGGYDGEEIEFKDSFIYRIN
jgi:hypothetical protein